MFARSVSRHLDAPLVGTAASAALRLFGTTPAAFVGVWPRIFPNIFRDFGTVRAEKAPGRATIFHEGCPDAIFEAALYPTSWEGIVLGSFDFVRAKNGQTRVVMDRAARTVTFHASWSER